MLRNSRRGRDELKAGEHMGVLWPRRGEESNAGEPREVAWSRRGREPTEVSWSRRLGDHRWESAPAGGGNAAGRGEGGEELNLSQGRGKPGASAAAGGGARLAGVGGGGVREGGGGVYVQSDVLEHGRRSASVDTDHNRSPTTRHYNRDQNPRNLESVPGRATARAPQQRSAAAAAEALGGSGAPGWQQGTGKMAQEGALREVAPESLEAPLGRDGGGSLSRGVGDSLRRRGGEHALSEQSPSASRAVSDDLGAGDGGLVVVSSPSSTAVESPASAASPASRSPLATIYILFIGIATAAHFPSPQGLFDPQPVTPSP